MAPFKALYGSRCRSPVGWFWVGQISLIGPELVYEAIGNVRLIIERLRTAKSRQKSYADMRRRDLEFKVKDWVYLKILPMKGVMGFGKKGNLSPRCIGDPIPIIPLEGLGVHESLSYEEVPIEILDGQVKRFRNKEIVYVKAMNTRRNNARRASEENVNESVPPQTPQNSQVLIEEGAMSNVEIKSAIHNLTQMLATQVSRDARVQGTPMLSLPLLR
ncbi:hypothetical protein MTR67_012107 [Solanum verrucosum]|uniref:Reverse transcriptase domain-containing protein n=1 Tax=Solanum verrucosum TaxID=315347 RepID=A0AAF0Q978_SOLVR|nr:hypothetical protein MTR67_012107 [Solanum verrucosum]